MRSMISVGIVASILAGPAFVQADETIEWNAQSGVPPYDSSIPQQHRFAVGNVQYVSMQPGFLNIDETSETFTTAISKTDIDPISEADDRTYEIELRMNSHFRPGFDVGSSCGIDEATGRRLFLLVARDAIGFADCGGADEWQAGGVHFMDTTDSFHTYRVVKSAGAILVFVDSNPTPVITLEHDDFGFGGPGSKLWLAQTSNPGVANFDVRRFRMSRTADFPASPVPALSSAGVPILALILVFGVICIAVRTQRRYLPHVIQLALRA